MQQAAWHWAHHLRNGRRQIFDIYTGRPVAWTTRADKAIADMLVSGPDLYRATVDILPFIECSSGCAQFDRGEPCDCGAGNAEEALRKAVRRARSLVPKAAPAPKNNTEKR